MTAGFRAVAFAMGLIGSMTLAPFGAARGAERTTLWVENASIDIGKVIAGKTASVTYVFHNDGPTDIAILRASPT